MWDPNAWTMDAHEFRIYGDDNAFLWAVVDEVDYQFCLQWLWSPKWSKRGKKVYLRRNVQEGVRAVRTQKTLYLHQAVMFRTGKLPPTPNHVIVDHRNGDGLDCRRANLRYATHSMNCKNINGQCGYDLEEIAWQGQVPVGKREGQRQLAPILPPRLCASAIV